MFNFGDAPHLIHPVIGTPPFCLAHVLNSCRLRPRLTLIHPVLCTQSLARAWSHVASFKIVYISEAHAVDEWPISSARCNGDRGVVAIAQPKSTSERCEVAARSVRAWEEEGCWCERKLTECAQLKPAQQLGTWQFMCR